MKIVRSLHIKSMTRLLDPQSYGATYLSISSNNYENSDLSYKIFNKEEMYKYKNGNFRKTMIYNATFDEVNLDNADFTETQNTASDRPPFVSFKKSSLINAIFKDAYLNEANFTDANLSGVDFTGANLRGVNFTGANLTGAKFTNVKNLAFANFTRATIVNVDFTGAVNVRFNTNFTDAIFAPQFGTSEYLKCNSYAFGCRNIDTVSDDALKNKIAENPTRFCNEVMGRSCGDTYNRESTVKRWENNGGKCRPNSEVKGSGIDYNCTTGCHKTEDNCTLCFTVCQ